jgi:CRISPR-associated protein Csm3
MPDIILQGKIILTGRIRAETGLHIGGSKTGIDIGGVDNPVIKDHENKPYIPGSSLKGKMRSLLEKAEGSATDDKRVWQKKNQISIHMCNETDCHVCNVFGRNNAKISRVKKGICSIDPNASKCPEQVKDGKNPASPKNCPFLCIKKTTPTLLIVRDAKLDEESIPKDVRYNLDLEWTEVKFENSIDRITSEANPRQQERVPRGAEFDFEIIYNVYQDKDKARFKKVLTAMQLLEDDYLGGSGSRGYGKVSFQNVRIFWNSSADYKNGNVDISAKKAKAEGRVRELAKKMADESYLNAIFSQEVSHEM